MSYEDSGLIEINSFEEYLLYIKNYCKKNKGELWYRGHNSNTWQLKPNLYRGAKMLTGSSDEIVTLEYDFVNFKKEFYKLKKEIIKESLFDISKLNDFHIMFIAQHYGLLTPILDWTTDPLVALFFAMDGYTYKENEFPVIYILKPGLCNANSYLVRSDKTNITEPLCIDGMNKYFDRWVDDLNNSPANYIPIAIFSEIDFSHRICRQSGKFTLHGALGPLNFSWNDIAIGDEKLVDAIKINPEAVKEIEEYLAVLNINKKSIYRDVSTKLDNICNEIKEQELKIFKNNIAESNKELLS